MAAIVSAKLARVSENKTIKDQEYSMAKSSNKPLSIALIIAGAGLAIWGYQKSGGFQSKISSALTGSPADNVMMLYIAGAVCLAVGVFLNIKK